MMFIIFLYRENNRIFKLTLILSDVNKDATGLIGSYHRSMYKAYKYIGCG